jgi:hypothetical protein
LKRLVLIALLAACGPANVSVATPAHSRARHPEMDRFVADEERILVTVAATDPRIAARGIAVDADTLHHATMRGILAEDPTLGMEGDRPDVFSFDARGRALDAASAIVAKWKVPPDDADPSSVAQPGLELELLRRFIASEKLRLAGERALPRSASTLLAATAATWRPLEVKDVSDRDDWLSKRLGDVTASLAPQSLTALEREELEDAIDPLERIVGDALPKSRAALVDLRIAVQRLDPAAKNADRWAEVAARLAADTGSKLSPETLLAFLGAEAKAIREEVGRLVGVEANEAVGARAGEWLAAPPESCHAATPGSRMRALEPPPERAFACSLRARVIAAKTSADEIEVLVAMHDAVLAATWALVFARGGSDETLALAAPKPLTPMSPTVEGRLRRFAAVHPVEAVSRALSIEWLMRNGLGEAALRAEAWTTFGDAPLDVIEHELQPHPRAKSHFRQSTEH